MKKEEIYVGQFFQLWGVCTHYGVVTKINNKTFVIQYNLSGRILIDYETMSCKKSPWIRISPIKSDNIELQKIAYEYCKFGDNEYKNTKDDYIYQLSKKGIFDKLTQCNYTLPQSIQDS